MDFDVRRLALVAAQRLVNHHARVRQAETFAFGARGQQEGAHRARLPHTDGADVRLDELHGVVNRHARGDHPARRVDVEENVFFRAFRFEEQHLRHDQVGHVIFHLAGQENDALFQQAGIDVVRTLPA